MHRDLKPDNIMIKNQNNLDRVCLIDFGFATFFNLSQKQKHICGSAAFMSPELLIDRHGYTQKVDIWAVGITLIYMLLGLKTTIHIDPKTK